MASIDEIKAGLSEFSDADLQSLLQDDRVGAKALAKAEIERRSGAGAGPVEREDYDPRKDPGPPRYEDQFPPAVDTPLSAEEVDPEESRRDETTVLASDAFDGEGNRQEQ